MSIDLEHIIVSEPPKKIKPHELGRYNPAWMDCSVSGCEFEPIPNNENFRYLWVVKFPRRLILGIEFDDVETARSVLKAFGIKKTFTDSELKCLLGMGHPTLSAHFTEVGGCLSTEKFSSGIGSDGKYIVKQEGHSTDREGGYSYGEAFYGGELNYVGSAWTINNHSGRHSGGKTYQSGEKIDLVGWRSILGRVCHLFSIYLNMDVNFTDKDISVK